jgi:hypothetical protein
MQPLQRRREGFAVTPYDWQLHSRIPVPKSDNQQLLFDPGKKPFPWLTLSAAIVAVIGIGVWLCVGAAHG